MRPLRRMLAAWKQVGIVMVRGLVNFLVAKQSGVLKCVLIFGLRYNIRFLKIDFIISILVQ